MCRVTMVGFSVTIDSAGVTGVNPRGVPDAARDRPRDDLRGVEELLKAPPGTRWTWARAAVK